MYKPVSLLLGAKTVVYCTQNRAESCKTTASDLPFNSKKNQRWVCNNIDQCKLHVLRVYQILCEEWME
jgi:hypothetical protein